MFHCEKSTKGDCKEGGGEGRGEPTGVARGGSLNKPDFFSPFPPLFALLLFFASGSLLPLGLGGWRLCVCMCIFFAGVELEGKTPLDMCGGM